MSYGFIATTGGVKLRFADEGRGSPMIFQHGLGGDERQVAEVLGGLPGVRRLTFECRGHGGSELGPLADLSIATFAADVAVLAAKLRVGAAVVGGISMGATIALRLAVKGPDLVKALILARPAWIDQRAPDNMRPYQEVAELLRRYDAAEAKTRFERSATARRLATAAPDNLASLLSFFDRRQSNALADVLAAIAADGPGVSMDEIRAIRAPTLVIAHTLDQVHPLAYGEALARAIPNSTLVEIMPKALDRSRYVQDFRAAVQAFLGDAQTPRA